MTRIMEGTYDDRSALNDHLHPATPTNSHIDRGAINAEEFSAYLALEHPAGIEQGWTPASAPERIIRNFLNDGKTAA